MTDAGGEDIDDARSQPRVFNHELACRAVRDLLVAIGEDSDREGLRATPDRVARAWREQSSGLFLNPASALDTTFDEHHDEMILVRGIEMSSTCEHHLLPFGGLAHVGYLPNASGAVTGLSKLARLVDAVARRPQVQERLTTEIADILDKALQPQGVIVVIEAEHQCMSFRGVRKPGAVTITSAVRGLFRTNDATRAEAMSLILR